MLDEEEKGVVKKKKQEKKAETNSSEEDEKLLKQFMDGENLREDLCKELPLYFKMKTKYFSRIQPVVEKEQDTKKRNEKVQELKKIVEEKREELKQKNKWLNEKGHFDFSGSSLDENTYDRYWYGVLWVTAERYIELKK